jgi:hypothetical protein
VCIHDFDVLALFKELKLDKVVIFGWVLRRTNTGFVMRRLSSLTGGGKPRVPFYAIFQARMVI